MAHNLADNSKGSQEHTPKEDLAVERAREEQQRFDSLVATVANRHWLGGTMRLLSTDKGKAMEDLPNFGHALQARTFTGTLTIFGPYYEMASALGHDIDEIFAKAAELKGALGHDVLPPTHYPEIACWLESRAADEGYDSIHSLTGLTNYSNRVVKQHFKRADTAKTPLLYVLIAKLLKIEDEFHAKFQSLSQGTHDESEVFLELKSSGRLSSKACAPSPFGLITWSELGKCYAVARPELETIKHKMIPALDLDEHLTAIHAQGLLCEWCTYYERSMDTHTHEISGYLAIYIGKACYYAKVTGVIEMRPHDHGHHRYISDELLASRWKRLPEGDLL